MVAESQSHKHEHEHEQQKQEQQKQEQEQEQKQKQRHHTHQPPPLQNTAMHTLSSAFSRMAHVFTRITSALSDSLVRVYPAPPSTLDQRQLCDSGATVAAPLTSASQHGVNDLRVSVVHLAAVSLEKHRAAAKRRCRRP
jgi:hypothetical protein